MIVFLRETLNSLYNIFGPSCHDSVILNPCNNIDLNATKINFSFSMFAPQNTHLIGCENSSFFFFLGVDSLVNNILLCLGKHMHNLLWFVLIFRFGRFRVFSQFHNNFVYLES